MMTELPAEEQDLPLQKVYVGYDTKLHLMVRHQF